MELFPILEKEIEHKQYTRDYVRLKFKNKSQFDIVAVKDSTRGGRRHGGTLEEVRKLPYYIFAYWLIGVYKNKIIC